MKIHHLQPILFFSLVLSACDLPFPSNQSETQSSIEISWTSSTNESFSTSEVIEASASSSNLISSLNSLSSSESSMSSEPSILSSSETTSIAASSIIESSTSIGSSAPVSLITIPSNAPAYYQNISPTATGEALKSALDLLISSNIDVGYDWWRYESADESLTETNKVITIYPRRNYLKSAHVSGNAAATWNREHTYPQSKISGAALDDNHHIFADDWKTNSTRGNYRFGIVTTKNSTTQVKDSSNLVTDNYLAGGFFEPNDAAKGEVARATLYLNTIYGYAIDGNFQSNELAILWALQYPPTNRDMQRNNRVYDNQGNRNPYIDNRDYICKVYGLTSLNTRLACGLS